MILKNSMNRQIYVICIDLQYKDRQMDNRRKNILANNSQIIYQRINKLIHRQIYVRLTKDRQIDGQ